MRSEDASSLEEDPAATATGRGARASRRTAAPPLRSAPDVAATASADGSTAGTSAALAALHGSLLEIFRQVVHALPPTTTLGEIVAAARDNPQLAPLLRQLTVKELIDIAISRPREGSRARAESEVTYDEDGNPILALDAGPQIVRRRADVPDGDMLVLRALMTHGALAEVQIVRHTRLSAEQVRLLVRALKLRGLIHVEGTGTKRRIKITRAGGSVLRTSGS